MQMPSDRPDTTLEFLLSLADEINPPAKIDDAAFGNREFICSNGWRVTFFYDGGDLDYIDHFASPDGRVIDFWDWPDDLPERDVLINWRPAGMNCRADGR